MLQRSIGGLSDDVDRAGQDEEQLVGVFALFGNMLRCLPALETDLLEHAPGIHALCRRIGAQPSLSDFVMEQEREYGQLYCGGQIEQSIRAMLAMDESANGVS